MAEPKGDEAKPFINIEENQEIPELTKWHCLFGKRTFWIVDDNPYVNFFYYKLTINQTSIAHFMFYISIFIFYNNIYKYVPDQFKWIHHLLNVSYFLAVISLVRTFSKNPGFLPFYYPVSNKKIFTTNEIRSGFAYKPLQLLFAQSLNRDPRVSFSSKVGFFVIRADHFCGFIGQFIGLYNHRFFINTCLYLGIYLDTFFTTVFVLSITKHVKFTVIQIIFYLGTTGFFGFLVTSQLIHQIICISDNQTSLEKMKGYKKAYDRGVLNNWEEIFGPRKYMILWFIPFFDLHPLVDGLHYPKDEVNKEAEQEKGQEREKAQKLYLEVLNESKP